MQPVTQHNCLYPTGGSYAAVGQAVSVFAVSLKPCAYNASSRNRYIKCGGIKLPREINFLV